MLYKVLLLLFKWKYFQKVFQLLKRINTYKSNLLNHIISHDSWAIQLGNIKHKRQLHISYTEKKEEQ